MPHIAKALAVEQSPIVTMPTIGLPPATIKQPTSGWSGLERRAVQIMGASAVLKASEKRYRRLFETAKDGILILNADTGVVTDVNPYLTELLGYTHSELVGKTLWEIGPFRDTAASKANFRQLPDVEYLRYDNLPLETKEHEIRRVEFVSNLYLVDDERVVQCNIREISQRVHAEDDARRAHDEMSLLVVALEERDVQMLALNRMHDLLQACTTKEEAYKVISLMAGDLFRTRAGGVAIMHTGDQHLETVARWGGEALMESTFALNDCWAVRRGQPHEVVDASGGLPCAHFVSQPSGGSVCLPLTVQGETLGLLTLTGTSAASDAGRRNERRLAESMGEAIKLSLSNLQLREKLRDQATHDSLTGLLNMRYIEESLPRELARAARARVPLSVILLDLDFFKRVNDRIGHHAGDAFLRDIGALLRAALRTSDTAARYGGEEFLLVLPDSSVPDTLVRVGEICELVKGIVIPDAPPGLGPITVSGGVAAAGAHGVTPQELIRAADNALYSAKQAGRDRIVVYNP
jgi:diguanylate cyclase (GGDEF)-like protein/PAS domain S-box-containing protein